MKYHIYLLECISLKNTDNKCWLGLTTGSLMIAVRNDKWYNYFENHFGSFYIKVNIHLLYKLDIPPW